MKSELCVLSVCLALCAVTQVASATDAKPPPTAGRPALRFGYDVSGQVHNNTSLLVRSIIDSERAELPPIEGSPQNRLTFRVCNIEPGDPASNRPPAKLYFQWPDAGFKTEVLGEVPFEKCVLVRQTITGEVSQQTSDILYTYKARAIAAQDIWTMKWMPPWTHPARYWEHAMEVFTDATRGMKAYEDDYAIHTVRKRPADTGAYQTLRWRPGTELYLALPKLSAEQIHAYRASLGHYKESGLQYTIQSAQAYAEDFASDIAVLQGFEGRDVLKVEMAESREKDNQVNTIHITVPMSGIDLIQLPSVLRERRSGRPIYRVQYVIPGN